ncbi:MAG: hypothetical protein LBR37_00785 [Erysipelotrichaceae bacterium]|jgi:hypothetical protein|nr:hypothetical protein [Erysipelotrichaceae bacterium]
MKRKKFKEIALELVGKEFNDIFYQPTKDIVFDTNMCVINFGNENEYSLHVFCFLRITKNSSILLTASDEYFAPDYTRLSLEAAENRQAFENSLLEKNLVNIKKLLKNAVVKKILINRAKDTTIVFDSGIKIEITIDCMFENYEYYRIMKRIDKNEEHYVVKFKKGKVVG